VRATKWLSHDHKVDRKHPKAAVIDEMVAQAETGLPLNASR
jgi:hypothetical protein